MGRQIGKCEVVHLTASPFFGGPERQMLGLAQAMRASCHSTFLCLMEGGKAQPFVEQLQQGGIEARPLQANHPHLVAATREVAHQLRLLQADVLLAHGYKADIIGLPAARMAGIPIIMVSRGWTWATRKVRFYEKIDRLAMRLADRVVCVSKGQAEKVLKADVAERKVSVIRNSVDVMRFDTTDPPGRNMLQSLLPEAVRHIVLAVGRLSPEKGFELLVKAAANVCAQRPDVGFVLIGEGPEREVLEKLIEQANLQRRFVLAGFRKDVDRLLPHASCVVQSSYTEGMPNVLLEAMAARVPVVATDVGGTPELVVHGQTGFLVPPAQPSALATGIMTLLGEGQMRAEMGQAGRVRVEEQFTFTAQASAYLQLLQQLVHGGAEAPGSPVAQTARV